MIFAGRALLVAVFFGKLVLLQAVGGDYYCRCEAEFERFYDRRRRWLKGGGGGATVHHADITSHVNDDGNYVVNGIVVLPSDSKECVSRAGTATGTATMDYFMYRFGHHRELLEGEDVDQDQESMKGPNDIKEEQTKDMELRRNLKGSSTDSLGGKGGRGPYNSDYYYGGGGKGKGKNVSFISVATLFQVC